MKQEIQKDFKANVLIVEDELIVGIDLKKTLERNGLAVIGSAVNSNEAIEFVKSGKPDIILMDIMLKDSKDGIITAEIIHSFVDIPVVFLTAYSDAKTINRAKKVSPYGYVLKPFDEKELLITIEITLYKHSMEKRLKESEEKYKRLVEGSPDITYGYSKKHGSVYWSARVRDILGYAPSYLSKNPFIWHDSIHPDDLPLVDRSIDEAINGKPFEIEYRIKDKKNKWHWFSDHFIGKVIQNDDIIIEGLASDITAKKNAREEILKREAKLNSIFKAAPVGIGVSINRVIMEANDTLCTMTGYSKEELIGMNAKILYPTNADYEFVGREKYGQITEFGSGSVETRWRKKNGEIIDIILSSSPLNQKDWGQGVTFIALDITDRKIAELALEVSEREYRRIFETAHEGIWGVDELNRTTFVNDRMAEMLGFEISEIIGQKIDDFLFDEDLPDHKIKTKNRQNGLSEIYEQRFKKKNGEELWALVSASAITDEKNDFNGSFGMFTDITDRRKVEAALKTSEEKFRRIYDDSPVGALIVNLNQKLISVNKAFCNYLGYTENELIGRRIGDVTFADDILVGKIEIYKMISGELETAMLEKRFVRKNGEIVWGQVNIKLMSDEWNKPLFFLPIILDITEQKKAQKQLLESEITYRGMINSIGETIFIIDEEGKFLDTNLAAETLFGYEKEEIINKNLEYLSNPAKNDLVELNKIISEAYQGIYKRFEFWGRRKDGTNIPLEVSINICDYFGRTAFIAVGRDISERKKSEQVLRDNSERLRTVINATPDIICFKDAYGRWIQANDSILELYQLKGVEYYNKTELQLASFTTDIYRESFKANKNTDEKAWASGTISRALEIIPDANRNDHVFDVVKIPLFNEDNSRRGLVVFGRDITEIKKTEEALRQSEQNYREIFNSTNEAIFIQEAETGKVIDVNESMLQMYGCSSRDEVISSDFENFSVVEKQYNIQAANRYIHKALKEGPQVFEWLARKKNGENFWLEISLKNTSIGGQGRMLAVARDITERKIMQEALQENERKLSALMGNLPGMAYRCKNDSRWTMEFISEGCYDLTGYPNFDLVGNKLLSYADLIDPLDSPEVWKEIQSAINKMEKFQIMYRIVTADGKTKWVWEKGTGIYSDDGNVLGIEGFIMDITDRKHAEENLESLASKLTAVVENFPGGIIMENTERRIEIANANLCGMLSLSVNKNELIGADYLESLGESKKLFKKSEDFIREIEEVIIKNESLLSEELELKDGRIFERDYIPIMSSQKLIDHLWIYKDVTERKRAEETIRESEERFRTLIDKVSGIAVQGYKADGTVMYWNKASEDIYGYTRKEAIGKSLLDLIIPPIMREEVLNAITTMAETCKGLPAEEIHLMRKDGSLIPLYSNHTVIHIPGREMELYSIDIDLTKLKETEKALIESEERYRRIFENTHSAMLVIDPQTGCIVDANPAAEMFYGWSRDALKKMNITDINTLSLKEMESETEKARLTNKRSFEFKHKLADGSIKDVEIFSGTINLAGREMLFSIVHDITQRKDAEMALRKSEAQLSNALSISKMGHWEYDVINDEFYFNDHFYALFKTTVQEIGSYKMSSFEYSRRFLHPEDSHMVSNEILTAIEAGDPNFSRDVEHRIIYADGSSGYILVRFFIAKDEHGKTIKTYGVNQDITARKLAEETIRTSEEKFRVSFLTSPDSINIVRLKDGLVVDVNDGFLKVTGYKREDIVNHKSNMLKLWVHPEDRDKYIEELRVKGFIQNFQTEFYTNSGRIGTCLISSSIITIANEKCILSITRDISEKVKHDIELNEYRLHLEELVDQRTEQIKKHNIFLRTLIDTIPNPIFVMDKQGRYTEINKGFEKFYDVSREETLGKTIDYLTPKDVIEINNEYDARLLSEHMSVVYETYYINKDGKRIELLLYKASFGDVNREPDGLTGLVVDISKRKEMELMTKEAYQKEKELNEMKTNFISTASHEFRTPLTTILTSADLLQMNFQKWDIAKILKHINRIQESVGYMTILLEDVLTLSRSDRGKIVLSPVEINLNELCFEIIEHTKLQMKENHRLIYNYDAPSEKYVVDPKLITHMLSNLLTNAVKFSPMGGEISLLVDVEDNTLRFIVSDQGIGIMKSDLSKIFEPFFRADNAIDIKGSGLGMSIVKRSVETHNGEINIHSTPGKGSTFIVKIKLI